jgi:hypothetical protein
MSIWMDEKRYTGIGFPVFGSGVRIPKGPSSSEGDTKWQGQLHDLSIAFVELNIKIVGKWRID